MDDLKQIHDRLLEMLAFFHSFCEQHGLTYYAQGGTMLGAVRHEGFIPWDYDVDVGMPRRDYEKLREFTGLLDGRYLFETVYSSNEDFCYPFSKLYDTTTTLVENIRQKTRRGIYIDIFPLDGLGDSQAEAERYFQKMEWRKYLLGLRTIAYRKDRALYKNAAIFAANLLPKRLAGAKKLCLKINAMCQRDDFDASAWGGNLMGAWGWKEVVPRSVYGTPTLYRFETIEIYGAEDYEGYLTSLYGDWRKLPSPEKRVTHHNNTIDLETSYLD